LLDSVRHFYRFVRGALLFRPESTRTIAVQLEEHAEKTPDAVFLRFEQELFTYAQANALINRHAHAYRGLGVSRGKTIALVMDNRPSFLWHLFGLHKIGGVPSLVNTNLSGNTLAHALRACEPFAIVAGGEVWPTVREVVEPLRAALGAGADGVWADFERASQGDPSARDFAQLLLAVPATNPDVTLRPPLGDLAAYIYTSGTTGLPKAALVPHHRTYRAGAVWSGIALRYARGDVMYCCLPLYHSNAMLLALGSVVTAGATLALARKFSRTRFWQDARMHRATHMIYIGELCRYLMNAEPSPADRDHGIRVATGNGLRPDIWEAFQKRFGLARIAEFYAATEGNCVTLNPMGRVGSCGPLMPNMRLVRWDEAAQQIVRDAAGKPIPVPDGEPGILLGKITPKAGFDGYREPKATAQKILRDVFEPGDAYFNTGDLLVRRGRWKLLYFSDRLGDTFRWKGENVSTTEVQEALSSLNGVAEVNAYGVRVNGTEGRAGMVAVVMAEGARFDPDAFKAHTDRSLPGYARPIFVRVSERFDTTATFKLKKQDLQEQGFNPERVSEPLYLRHPQRNAYVPLDQDVFAQLESGALKL
jgi:acyl-CoA synthetase (AMP-forming)/AMP-acid ligase II